MTNREQITITLQYFEYEDSEVAKMLGICPSTVSRALQGAQKNLIEHINTSNVLNMLL